MSIVNKNKVVRLKLTELFLHLKFSLSTKTKTHYETLGISPNATYSEIKTAYYDLTLKYHPDKNKSDSAKAIFQEISNAYDVLSKYDTRKHYDRTLKIKQSPSYEQSQVKDVRRYKPRDPLEHASPKFDTYNFDDWLRHHYKESFERHRKAREKISIIQKEDYEGSLGSFKTAMHGMFIIIMLVLLGYYYRTVKEARHPTLNIKREK